MIWLYIFENILKMDITTLFKACVKTVKTTNKQMGISENTLKSNNSLFKSNFNKDVNLAKAKDIVKQITYLQNFLIENKQAYINVLNYLSTNKTMSESDREKIDNAAQNIVSSCSSLIKDYKREIAALKKSKQKEEHYNNVIESLERYLKHVSKVYTEAKALRVKKVIDTHKLSKLETTPVKISRKISLEESTSNKKSNLSTVDYDNELSSEEMQMFENENDMLFNELNSISDEVKSMESKVVHIAELQEMFTEKVLQQEKDIERISATVIGSTENMKDANEQIRQAIQRNAGLRVWVLFFLLVMSFSLLFLDWYND